MKFNYNITTKNGTTISGSMEMDLAELREFHVQALDWFERRNEIASYVANICDIAIEKTEKILTANKKRKEGASKSS